MTQVKVKRILRNGNLSIRFSTIPGTKVVWVNHNDNQHPAIINVSNQSIFLKGSYNTTANGRCDDLIIKPEEGILQLSEGSAWSFGTYMVFEYITKELVNE